MKNISKILGVILAMTVLAVILAVGTFAADESYTLVETGNCDPAGAITWSIYAKNGKFLLEFNGTGVLKILDENGDAIIPTKVDNKWQVNAPWNNYEPWLQKVIIGDGITSLDYYTLAFHRGIQTVELGKDVTSLGYYAFQGCNALQTIYRKGNLPEASTFDLRGITNFGAYVFDNCNSFSNVIFPTEGSYTLRAGFMTSNDNLTSIYLPSGCYEVLGNAFDKCTNLTTVCVESNSTAIADNAFPTEVTKITTPHNVTVVADGKTVATLNTYQIDSILEAKDVTYVLYADESCTQLLTGMVVTQNTTVYAKKLLEFVGCEVRIADYNGLRFVFDYNPNAFSGASGYTVDVLGVLGAKNFGITPVFDHNYTAANLSDTQLMVDGTFTGKFIGTVNGCYRFAYTAIGYDDGNGDVVRSNAATVILSKAYVSLTDSYGNQGVIYSAQGKKDLYEICKATRDTGMLADTSFIDETLKDYALFDGMEVAKEMAYTYLEYMYSQDTNILSGQHLYSDTPTTVKDEMQKIYEKTGKYPAVLSYDVAKGYRSYKDKSPEEQAKIIAGLVEQFKDFSKQGGLITFCAHTTNPVGSYGSGNVYEGSLTTAQWNALWSNETFLAELDAYAVVMQAMEDAGIPIFWRPYHEANLSNFWWGQKNIPSDAWHYYVEVLWRNTHDYLEDTKGLSNLIWIYSPLMAFKNGASSTHMEVYYPGDDYVDVKAIDWYHNSLSNYFNSSTLTSPYNSLAGVGSKKPMVYGEFGPNEDLRGSYTGVDAINNLTKLKNNYGWQMGWVVFWSEFKDAPISLDSMENAKYFIEHELIFDLEESRIAYYDTMIDYIRGLFS